MSALDHVMGHQLLFVTGKGGVGKSAIAAAFARGLAARGKTVLATEVDPRETLHELFGIHPSGGEPVAAGPRVTALNLDPRRVIERLVRDHVKIEMITKRVLASTVFEHFTEGAPGLKELAVLAFVKQQIESVPPGGTGRVDVAILDAPATGHGLSLLTAPRLVSGVIDGGPFGRMAEDLAKWTATPERAGVIVVTRPEEMPVQEALELRDQLLTRLDRKPLLLVVNALYPPFPVGPIDGVDAAALDLWRRRRAVQEEQLARLDDAWDGPRVVLPYLPLPRGTALLGALALRLEAEGGAP